MRWWQRLLVTLVLAPLLWRLGVSYIASQQGSTWSELAQQSIGELARVYLVFTGPALILCLVLLAVDRMLQAIGLDLMTVLISPLLALGIAEAVLSLLAQRQVGMAATEGAVSLAVVYGLVWGLTIRERHHSPDEASYIETA